MRAVLLIILRVERARLDKILGGRDQFEGFAWTVTFLPSGAGGPVLMAVTHDVEKSSGRRRKIARKPA